MGDFSVRAGIGTYEFAGELLAEVSTRTAGRPRWTELALYAMSDGRWLACSRGPSLYFHKLRGGCGKGFAGEEYGSLPAGMVACPDCWRPRPLGWDPAAMVRPENDRPRATVCAAPREVLTALLEQGGRRGADASHLSHPARHLLEEAGRSDPAIAALLGTAVRLTP